MSDRPVSECPRCGGHMEAGHMLDEGYGVRHPMRWIAGARKEGWFSGLKINDRRQYRVDALRCEACGWLDLFARERHV